MHLGDTQCRIHGSNDSIGNKKISSGCVRLTHDDVSDVNGRSPVASAFGLY
jgi:lipoprotein-anchoring transpeptidase ErfK/SrfK